MQTEYTAGILDSAVVFIKTRSGFFVTTPRIGLQQLS
jgi:hypothetical protein